MELGWARRSCVQQADESEKLVVEAGRRGEPCRPLCEVLITGLPEGGNQVAIGAKNHIPTSRLPGTRYTLLYKFPRMAELALKIGDPMTVPKHAK